MAGRNKGKLLQWLMLLVCLASAGILLYDMIIVPKQNQELSQQLKEAFPENPSPGGSSPEGGPKQAGEESQIPAIDLVALQKQYPDVKGWITIPGTTIDYPVLQSSEAEPEFYLKHNYKKEWDSNGSLFLQWNCDVSESQNLVLYGHNMNSGAMFGNLDDYTDYGYWQEHQKIYFQTGDGVSEFVITAVLKTDVQRFPFQRVSFPTEEALIEYVEQAKGQALFETGVDSSGIQVLTLITCSYEWQEARNVVIGIKR